MFAAPLPASVLLLAAIVILTLLWLRPGSAWQVAANPNCELSSNLTDLDLSEGPTDYSWNLPAAGTVDAVMIFLEFSDALHGTESTTDLYDLLVPNAQQWFTEVSYGKMSLNVTPVNTWYTMPSPSTDYGMDDGVSSAEQRAYISDAIAISDADVDYSQYQIVYFVSSNAPAIANSPTFLAHPETGFIVDGAELRLAVTFGHDIRVELPNYGSNVLIHETGHILGLPDLYSFEGFPYHRFVGQWDPMGSLHPGRHMLAWHKQKLGWLDASQILCLADEQVEATIAPLETAGGLKAIVIPTGPSTAYVLEVRRPIGKDGSLCDQGVLIYTVDANAVSGFGPIQVIPAHGDDALANECGRFYDAPFDLGPGEVALYEDPAVPLTIELVGTSDGSYDVRVTVGSVGAKVTPTPTPTPTLASPPEATAAATATATATATPTPTRTAARAVSPTGDATATPSKTPTPSPSSTMALPTTPPGATAPLGDVNCDTITDPIDAALILQLNARLISGLPCPGSGDVNGDLVTNPLDAALILQFSAGLISQLEVP